MGVLDGRRIVLAVTGGIAAYKSAELTRLLIKDGAQVKTAMTEAATRFVTPLTFQTLTLNPVAVSLWREDLPGEVGHISLADWPDLAAVAPATANIIAKLAHGLADDLVSTFLLAVKAPILVCPAMNVNMFENQATQANLQTLRERGIKIVEPASGELACGWEGQGRLPDPVIILEEIRKALSPDDLAGRTVLVTSGPTREAWDDIRYLSNRSTGQMGLALARTAWRRGAKVILVTGPAAYEPPYGVETIPVESTRDMREAVLENLPRAEVLVKAAAPGDFRPAEPVKGKVKKGQAPPAYRTGAKPGYFTGSREKQGEQDPGGLCGRIGKPY